MCVVSMIGDHYQDKWKDYDLNKYQPNPYNPLPGTPLPGTYPNYSFNNNVSRAEFEALKREVEEMKALLIRAKEYDERNNEPDCEMEDKVELLKKVAELVGVDLAEVFGNSTKNS